MIRKKEHTTRVIYITTPDTILEEVKNIVLIINPQTNFKLVENVFKDMILLFRGDYPGYRSCTNKYHDVNHTMDAFLAMARMMHGANEVKEIIFSGEEVVLGLISALFHDVGYIQKKEENIGTGARFTLTHVKRGIDFARKYLQNNNFTDYYITESGSIIEATDFSKKITDIEFTTESSRLLGRLLATADLLGQLADRYYLEKLHSLFEEFQEGNVPGPQTLDQMYIETISFFDNAQKRMQGELGNLNHYMLYYFKARWNISRDLYKKSFKLNRSYLESVLKKYDGNYFHHFRRKR